jgi:hypothetical protein
MDTKRMIEKMENLKKPGIPELKHQRIFKLTLLNTRQSSRIGIILISLPAFILGFGMLQYFFNFNIEFHALDFLGKLPLFFRFALFYILIAVLPLASIVLNACAILYFKYDKESNEFNINIKLKWLNIFIVLIGTGVLMFYVLHLVFDYIGGKV